MKKLVLFSLFLLSFIGCEITETEVVPLPPGNLVATVVSSIQVDLVWKDNSTNETGSGSMPLPSPPGNRTTSGTRTLSSKGQPFRKQPCEPSISPCTDVKTTSVRAPSSRARRRPKARSVASRCAWYPANSTRA